MDEHIKELNRIEKDSESMLEKARSDAEKRIAQAEKKSEEDILAQREKLERLESDEIAKARQEIESKRLSITEEAESQADTTRDKRLDKKELDELFKKHILDELV